MKWNGSNLEFAAGQLKESVFGRQDGEIVMERTEDDPVYRAVEQQAPKRVSLSALAAQVDAEIMGTERETGET